MLLHHGQDLSGRFIRFPMVLQEIFCIFDFFLYLGLQIGEIELDELKKEMRETLVSQFRNSSMYQVRLLKLLLQVDSLFLIGRFLGVNSAANRMRPEFHLLPSDDLLQDLPFLDVGREGVALVDYLKRPAPTRVELLGQLKCSNVLLLLVGLSDNQN